MKLRPVGISIIAAVLIILGVYYLVWSILLLTSGAFLTTYDMVFFGAMANNRMLSAFLGIFTTVVMIATGIGLLQMNRWAWYLTFLGAVMMLVHQLFGLHGGNVLWAIIQLAIVAALSYYLLSPDVRRAFGIGTTPS